VLNWVTNALAVKMIFSPEEYRGGAIQVDPYFDPGLIPLAFNS